ncbi:MAG TPA: NADH-quinone oxidoreductase subunit J [Solirubrobacteraceae bacterium]|nr:NADH-quinone oxidoreductase subunit J [Solirubrobacteraceae bacterium]
MSYVIFFLAAIIAIAGALGVVMLRDPFFSVLSLVCHLIALALLFLLLRAELIAAVQVVVYAGAVMVLYVFVVAYIGDGSERLADRLRRGTVAQPLLRTGALLAGSALLAELLIALTGSGLKAVESAGAPYHKGPRAFGTPAFIGKLLLTRFLLAFEIASFLLLVAAVGAVVLAGRRGREDEEAPPQGAGAPALQGAAGGPPAGGELVEAAR